MLDCIYIEEAVREHPRSKDILSRFPQAQVINCGRYTEIFNRKAQNFRLQKRLPALILARKHEKFIRRTPAGYGIGGAENFYYAHMLNCIYDCRYCYLQGMFRSAHYVLFVNFEDFDNEMAALLEQHSRHKLWFFSGYDCDSLALEPVSRFAEHSLHWFKTQPNANLELRTKSTQIRSLLKHPPLDNVVVAFSLNPDPIIKRLEHKTPSLERRLAAIKRLQQAGWPVGLRFDPLIYCEHYPQIYRSFFHRVFHALDPKQLHSISLGPFRMPRAYLKPLRKLYPDEPLLAGELTMNATMQSYPAAIETELVEFCRQQLLELIDEKRLFPLSVSIS